MGFKNKKGKKWNNMFVNEKAIEKVVNNSMSYSMYLRCYENLVNEIKKLTISYNEERKIFVVEGIFYNFYTNKLLFEFDAVTNSKSISYACDCPICGIKSGCAHVGVFLRLLSELDDNVSLPYEMDCERYKEDRIMNLKIKNSNRAEVKRLINQL